MNYDDSEIKIYNSDNNVVVNFFPGIEQCDCCNEEQFNDNKMLLGGLSIIHYNSRS